MTARAAEIGWRVVESPATAPAARSRPSMIEASSSLRPSAVKAAPRPALNNGSSSSIWIAASTASMAEPPARSTAAPALAAAPMASR